MHGILVILLVFMIIGALIAIETTDLLSAVICVGAVGFVLSIAFLLLGAPDIAITQVVVDILSLVILIRATVSRDLTTISGGRELFGLAVTLVLVLVVGLVTLRAIEGLPEFGEPVNVRFASDAASAQYLERSLTKTGAANAVTAIILDFRAYDTLGEATVLFCAILGAVAILRKRARNHPDDWPRGDSSDE